MPNETNTIQYYSKLFQKPIANIEMIQGTCKMLEKLFEYNLQWVGE